MAEAQRGHADRWTILRVSMCVTFMSLLDVTIVNIALPSIRDAFDTGAAQLQWIISGYALAFGLLLVTGGRLGDALGRRRLMTIGVAGFTISSLACGLAPTMAVLIAARFVQGASAGLMVPQNTGLIQSNFTGAERGRAFGYMGAVVGVSSSIGPVLGGVLIGAAGETNGWRLIFLVNVPIGAMLLFFIRRYIPGGSAESRRPDIDIVGAVLLGLTVLTILYPISSVEQGFTWQFAIIAAAPVLAVAWAIWERRLITRGREPLLNIPLLRVTPGYATGMTIGLLYFCGYTGVLLVYSIYLQTGLGYSAVRAGLFITPFAAASAIAAPIAGRLVARLGRATTLYALGLLMFGLALAAIGIPLAEGTAWSIPVQVITMAIAGLGAGAVVGPNMTMTLSHVPPRMGGAAGAAVQTAQRCGNAIGAATLLLIYTRTVADGGAPGTSLRAVWIVSIAFAAAAFAVAVRDLRTPAKTKEPKAVEPAG
ncbi:MFS transporter [Dietzia sp.]|uniref:MFS transporter n=1 Tax=Dietzia sp. TaxID=1871616 RepID=UPI002FD91A2B